MSQLYMVFDVESVGLPIHDPLADARQSARLLIEALNRAKHNA